VVEGGPVFIGSRPDQIVTYLLVGRGVDYGSTGQLARAADCFDDALEVALLTGSDDLRGTALAYRCWIATWRGDLREAVRLGEEALAAAAGIGGSCRRTAELMLAQARIYTGDTGDHIGTIVEACGGPELTALDPASRPRWQELFAYAEAARHRTAEALAWADRAGASAARLRAPVCTGFAELARAHASAPSDPGAAARWATAAVASFEAGGDPVNAGRAYLRAGIAYGARGETGSARARFARARALFDGSGAGLFLTLVAREERRMNARQPRRRRAAPVPGTAAHSPGLTSREQEITTLVAIGLTNRQIADRLYLSPRTVEAHLTRVFAKLNVTTRTAAAHRWSALNVPFHAGRS
jgi:DNA-binding CsgD family transcriptional regulator